VKILILTGKFGMGHWSAARALEEQLARDGHTAQVVDLFDYAMPEAAPALYRAFSLLVTYGGAIYNLYHRLSERLGDDGFLPMERLGGRLGDLLDETDPALVLSTHPVCSRVMGERKLRGESALPLVTCITDVTCHSEWLHPATDCYLVAEESVRRGLAEKGVDPDRVEVSGIPVSGRFSAHRRGDGPRELLVMGGGLGLMPRKDSFYRALNDLPGVHTTILTGRNEKLYRRLAGKYPHIEAVPFTDRVPEYMGRANLMLSKPGGITTFEAVAARLPMLAWEPFLNQERENARFLLAHGMARVAAKEESACLAAIRGTIYDDDALAGMERAMDRLAATLRRGAACAVVRALAREEVTA
jgi:UDP-N-acetylglucosamine:LPS N-acetylglucosamine transferase